MKKIFVLVLAPTDQEGCGVAEYTRRLYEASDGDIEYEILDLDWRNLIRAPFKSPAPDIIHIQHEYFLFDRLVGISALFWYLLIRLFSKAKIVTTFHSTYDIGNLDKEFSYLSERLKLYLPIVRAYLKFHVWWITKMSDRVVVLSSVGLKSVPGPKVTHIRLGVYGPTVNLGNPSIIKDTGSIFVLFGFCFPNKGFDLAIQALSLVAMDVPDVRMFVVSGRPSSKGITGVGAEKHLNEIKSLVKSFGLESKVCFTGYLDNDSRLLGDLVLKASAFIFPYRKRNCPSGALAFALHNLVPIILSDIESFRDYPGLKFIEGDAVSLANCMVLMMNREWSLRFKGMSIQYALNNSVRSSFLGHLELFKEILC